MRWTYDADVDALYLSFRALDAGEARTVDAGDGILLDVDADNAPSGLEILDVTVFRPSHLVDRSLPRDLVETVRAIVTAIQGNARRAAAGRHPSTRVIEPTELSTQDHAFA
ncbi:MAG: DUF2283 domain-containing protein [Ilumatobacteraceae bacterium]